ncbi:hypothetical protein L1987_18516 [Smallanthus sonchifolius]|uniref:Uncharacterized protein n=1 Tax=Smallanthus sonchifolius TaxID=185202 RepID=A0ACB9J102_9ASTR|nr:hypothetical protein L1987_18516 [Smallanthus sonchifolius]
MSVARFERLLGLYTRHEILTELFTEGITELSSEEDKDQFWHEFGFGMYDSSLTKASSLRDPLHRVLHRCIIYSIYGRGQGETVVNLRELFYLYCLVRPRTCNLAHCITWYLVNSSGRDVTSAICGDSSEHAHGQTTLARARLMDRWGRVWDPDRPGPDPDFVQAEAEAVGATLKAHAAQQEQEQGRVDPRHGHEHHEPDHPPPPPPPLPSVVIPQDLFMRYWTWQYEVQCAAAAAGGAPYVVPLPFFMQPQPPPSPQPQPPPSPPHHQSPPPSLQHQPPPSPPK